MMWGFGAGVWWMPLIGLAFTALVVWLLVGLFRPSIPRTDNRAVEILEERFARGEIDRDEFEDRRAELVRR